MVEAVEQPQVEEEEQPQVVEAGLLFGIGKLHRQFSKFQNMDQRNYQQLVEEGVEDLKLVHRWLCNGLDMNLVSNKYK
jgi:hypothetical protein